MGAQWCITLYLLSWPVFVSALLLWLERDGSSVVYHTLPSFLACVCFCSVALMGEGWELSGVSYFTFFLGLCLSLLRWERAHLYRVSSVVYHILPSFLSCVCFCSAALVGDGCELSGVLIKECAISSCADHLCRSSFNKHLGKINQESVFLHKLISRDPSFV